MAPEKGLVPESRASVFIYLNFAFSRACFLRNQGYVVLPHVDSESDPPNFFPLVIFYLSAPFQGKKKIDRGQLHPSQGKEKGGWGSAGHCQAPL